ncbi:MAG TPA: hypothetical protein VFD15_05150 [Clostridia bacterium]|nr:hypothetical protein [Clostridia bacterium]
MFKKKWVAILVFGVLLILFATGGTLIREYASNIDKDEINILLKGALEDNSWMTASSVGELEDILGRYYTDPLLSELVNNTWEFISKPTDWYGKAKLENFAIIRYDSYEMEISAEISETDLIYGDKHWGEAIYTIRKTDEGWKVASAQYHWNMKDKL